MDKVNVYRRRRAVSIPADKYISRLIGSWQQCNRISGDFKDCVSNIATHDIVKSMKDYQHHGSTSCYQHSLHVAYYNYLICKKFGWDYVSATRAGMLHDLFLYDWHDYTPKYGERLHGFQHPDKALKNAGKYFDINKKEGDIIKKHMFPLTVTPPKYKEAYVTVLTDKFCSMCEVIDGFVRR